MRSGALHQAAIVAARRSKVAVDMDDFESATDRVIGGLESKRLITVCVYIHILNKSVAFADVVRVSGTKISAFLPK